MKYKNDASFVLGQDLYMFEQQATKNPNMPLRYLYYVSDMYEHQTGESELELIVRVININNDSNLLDKCTTLRDYMIFVGKVRKKKEKSGKDIKTAVTEAVDECIFEGILSDFFKEHREDVIDVSIYEYDEEGHMEIVREEGHARGLAEGRIQGRTEGLISQIIKKVKKDKDITTIAAELEEKVADIQPLYDAVIANAPEYDTDKIMKSRK